MAPALLRAATVRLREVVELQRAPRRDRYSVERLCAFKRFSENASYAKIVAIAVGSIILPLLLITALDAVPLQDPQLGWAANVSMWIRVFVGSFLLAAGNCIQLQLLAPDALLDTWKSLGIGMFTGLGNCAASILLARGWVFPVPFLAILTLPVWVTLFITGIVLAAGLSRLQQSPQLKAQLSRYATKLYTESNMLLVYSAYSVAFASLAGWSQVAFVFVLPVIKFVLKRIMKRMVADLEDLVPALVTTIDLFNAMYQSKCMQGSGSTLATVGIIGIDLIQNVYAIQQLFDHMEEVEALASDEIHTEGALAYAFRLASDPNQLDADEIEALQVRSCARLSMCNDHEAILKQIQVVQEEARQHAHEKEVLSDIRHATRTWTKILSRTAVQPFGGTALPPRSHDAMSAKEKAATLKRILEMLWKCERLLLVEYVEAAIPLLYAVYLAVLYHLPNAKYYPGVTDMDAAGLRSVITRIVVYAMLELCSLLFVHTVLMLRFKYSPLHQLAFTLKSEYLILQGLFIAWVVVILQFTLEHYGVDFVFRFSWVPRSRVASP